MQGLTSCQPLSTSGILERAGTLYRDLPISESLGRDGVATTAIGQVLDDAARAGHLLTDLGCEPGDVVATFAWNTVDHLVWYLAVPSAGMVLHTVNVRMSADDITYSMSRVSDRIIIVDADLWDSFAIVALPPTVRSIVVLGQREGLPTRHCGADVLSWEALRAGLCDVFEWAVRDETSASGICFTSGTSGRPKGVVYSHRSTFLHALGVCLPDAIGLSEAEIALPAVPMYHANAWGVPYAALLAGAQLALPGRYLDPRSLAALVRSSSATVSIGVPTVWQAVIAALRSDEITVEDIRSLRRIIIGGSAAGERLLRDLAGYGIHAIHGWGMTEISPVGTISSHDPGAPMSTRVSQGRPLPTVCLEILAEDGVIAPHDGRTPGELLASGPWVVEQYLDGDDESAFVELAGRRWLRTGDVATMTDDGYIKLVDRAKDMIKSGGEWISPTAVERALEDLDEIRSAGVVGVPDERWGERPHAFVTVSDGTLFDEASVRRRLEDRLPRWQIPDRFSVVNALPLTTVGKLDRKQLRKESSA